MNSPKRAKPDVVTYGDHELITPDTSKLRKLVRQANPAVDFQPEDLHRVAIHPCLSFDPVSRIATE